MTMTDNFRVSSSRIQDLIKAGICEKLDVKFCQEFDEYISNKYPWIEPFGYGIDWNRFKAPYKRLFWENASEEEVLDFIKNTFISNFKEIAFVYNDSGAGVIVKLDYLLKDVKNFENLSIFGIDTNFAIAVNRDKFGKIKIVPDCFIEIYNTEWLTTPDPPTKSDLELFTGKLGGTK